MNKLLPKFQPKHHFPFHILHHLHLLCFFMTASVASEPGDGKNRLWLPEVMPLAPKLHPSNKKCKVHGFDLGFDSCVLAQDLRRETFFQDDNCVSPISKTVRCTAATKCSCFCFKVSQSSEGIDEARIFRLRSSTASGTNDFACLN